MIRVFIGYDSQEIISYHVLSQSIQELASVPVSITPLKREQLNHCYSRKRNPMESTEFSFTRFLVPWLCNYEGWAIFMDCDFLALDDIAKLWKQRDGQYDLMVVKHDYTPREKTKFLGNMQTAYQKKNWSSMMLFNCSRCRMLSPMYVNNASGLELHQFNWAKEVGEVSKRWNHLVGVYDHDHDAALVHYTQGGPWFDEYRNCDYADEWRIAKRRMEYSATTTDIRAAG